MRDRIALFIASGTYLGYVPYASGTFGSLWGIPLSLGLARLSPGASFLVLLGSIAAGVLVIHQAWKALGVPDPPQIVLDEILGFMVSVWGRDPSLGLIILGFLLFRLFDIVKPFPARWVDQRIKGGWGILLDDLIAGIYTQASLTVLYLIVG